MNDRVKISDIADPASRFMASMKMNFDMWHDGTGYDLEALAQLQPTELQFIEDALIRHQPRDWRDIEALARIDSPKARLAIEAALTHSDPQVRNEAMKHAGAKANQVDRESALIKNLETANLLGGLGAAIDEAAEFHPPAVVNALFRGALHRDGEAAVHFAAMLFYIHGKTAEPFDWDHRPFFLRFNTTDSAERRAAFIELCQTVGVDPEPWLLGSR